MSLKHFVETPAIRQAFKATAARVWTGAGKEKCELLVPPGNPRFTAQIGTAFDYLARFRISRDILVTQPDAGIDIWDSVWIAELALPMMLRHPEYARWYSRWENLVGRARQLYTDFVAGRVADVGRIAVCVQYLAQIDLLLRVGSFNPAFKHNDVVTHELVALDGLLRPCETFAPRQNVLLNPSFRHSRMVGGADADLIIDGCIIDIKTTTETSIPVSHIRQLAGYAVLLAHGGAMRWEGQTRLPYEMRPEAVGIYSSRTGILHKWSLESLFPDDGFDRFSRAFLTEMRQGESFKRAA